MLALLFAALHPFVIPAEHGLFGSAGLYLVRVTAVEVPNHPKLYGPTRLRIDEVLIGPQRLKGSTATYEFFQPKKELHATMGASYSGEYPDFAYPAPKGQSRYWWASPDRTGDGWTTANFFRVHRFVPARCTELLLKADLKPDSEEAADRAELIKALLRLESKRTLVEQIAVVRELQRSGVVPVYSLGDRALKGLTTPPRPRLKMVPALPPK